MTRLERHENRRGRAFVFQKIREPKVSFKALADTFITTFKRKDYKAEKEARLAEKPKEDVGVYMRESVYLQEDNYTIILRFTVPIRRLCGHCTHNWRAGFQIFKVCLKNVVSVLQKRDSVTLKFQTDERSQQDNRIIKIRL